MSQKKFKRVLKALEEYERDLFWEDITRRIDELSSTCERWERKRERSQSRTTKKQEEKKAGRNIEEIKIASSKDAHEEAVRRVDKPPNRPGEFQIVEMPDISGTNSPKNCQKEDSHIQDDEPKEEDQIIIVEPISDDDSDIKDLSLFDPTLPIIFDKEFLEVGDDVGLFIEEKIESFDVDEEEEEHVKLEEEQVESFKGVHEENAENHGEMPGSGDCQITEMPYLLQTDNPEDCPIKGSESKGEDELNTSIVDPLDKGDSKEIPDFQNGDSDDSCLLPMLKKELLQGTTYSSFQLKEPYKSPLDISIDQKLYGGNCQICFLDSISVEIQGNLVIPNKYGFDYTTLVQRGRHDKRTSKGCWYTQKLRTKKGVKLKWIDDNKFYDYIEDDELKKVSKTNSSMIFTSFVFKLVRFVFDPGGRWFKNRDDSF